ncbi:hypothetical protein FVEN_g12780 [Fusarium venenatum]|nr:hypothetical protein FVEN_g12780 [Fusarium venenatum]
MNKGKNKAFDEDRKFRLTVGDLHDPSNTLESPRSVSKAQQVLDRYHDVLSLPSLMPSSA